MKKTDTSWGNSAGWYDELLDSEDSYQAKVIAPNLKRILGSQNDTKVLDLACGQGYFSRFIRDLGAHVIGVDISSELITYAKKKGYEHIEYFVSPADNLHSLKTAAVDTIVCVLAIQNVENISGTLAEAARVLKPDGKFILVINHPAFRVPQGSDWGYDESKKVQYRRIEKYLSEQKVSIEMHPGKKDSQKTISFHRSLQFFFKAFAKAGFATVRLEEWISHKASQNGPRKIAEDKARKEIPLFMCLELVKVK